MSLHYLLDGYNILKKIPAFRDLPLEDGRRGLLNWIDHARPQGSVNNQVIVVFDGHPDHVGTSQPHGQIQVIFSDGCSADDQIKIMLDDDAACKNCVVVSDDKDVFLYARALGARIMSVDVFTSKAKDYVAGPGQSGKHISLSHQEKINKELRGIWLKDK